MKLDDLTAAICGAVAVMATWYWLRHRPTNGDEYRLLAYLPFAIAFTCAAAATQRAAACSFSLFLTHLSLIRIVIYWCSGPKFVGFVISAILANVFAYFFAQFTEAKHKNLAALFKRAYQRRHAIAQNP